MDPLLPAQDHYGENTSTTPTHNILARCTLCRLARDRAIPGTERAGVRGALAPVLSRATR
ncbi:hypothetical protein [Arthrobacter sp. Ld5]|uniref:hypothetical protein n=1 Tax=Arthrobacter sp. Ld5 TaxID=649152 RepID=UPI003EBF7701